jgi:hypothetical protein
MGNFLYGVHFAVLHCRTIEQVVRQLKIRIIRCCCNAGAAALRHPGLVDTIGRSQPMQNDQTYFFSDIFLKITIL